MTRTYKKSSIVSGLSLRDVLDMDIATFNQLGLSDLKKVVGRLVSAGNKRLRTFQRRGEISPAVRHVMKSGGVFSTRGKNLNELRAEYVRAKTFLESRTGTLKGWKATRKETMQGLKKQGVDATPEQFDKMWKAYEKLKSLSPEVANKNLKYVVLKDISDMLDDKSITPDEIAVELNSKLDLIYEQRAELENGEGGVSEFFELQ